MIALRTVSAVILATLLMAAVAPDAHAFRCGTRIVSEGDDALKVLKHCGEPDLARQQERIRRVHRYDYFRAGYYAAEELVIVEYWTYDLGPRRLKRRITLENGWVTRIDTSARSTKYRHEADRMLSLSHGEKAVLCELLVRGPQAPGALKPRVARMGFTADPHAIRGVLEQLRGRPGHPLVEEQPKRPRERDQRWGHLLGPAAESHVAPAEEVAPPAPSTAPSPAPAPAPAPAAAATPDPDLVARVERLEQQFLALSEELFRLRGKLE